MVKFEASTPQLSVIKKWIDAYTSLDISKVEPLLAKNYQHQSFPESADVPDETKAEHIQKWGEILAASAKLEVEVHDVVEEPGKVVYHASAVCTTIHGTTVTYHSVVIFTLIEEDGELKILNCKDFADAQKRDAFIAGTAKAVA